MNEREALKHTLQYLEAEIAGNSATPLTVAEVNYLLISTNDAGKDAIHIHTCIMHQNPSDVDVHAAEYTSIRKRIGKAISALTGIKMSFDASTSPSTSTARANSCQAELRLPKLELFFFDGDLQQWISFRDLFVTAVHNNQSLSKSQKFTYLKAQLRGEALRQIQSMIISDSKYDLAWTQLATRYHNERELLFCIMKRLFNQPYVNEPTATAIRQLVDTTRECLRSMEILNCPVEHYDAFITYILFIKLDSTSQELWGHGLNNSSIPELKNLYDFLESRARALAASKGGSNSRSNKQQHNMQTRNPERSKQTKVTHTFKLHCIKCDSSTHNLHKCPDFLSLTAQSRFEVIRKLQGCINCLRSDHTRVVFDASMKASNGISLNDQLMVGPTIQDTLYNIILRFRCHKIAFTADIAKMYRQIIVDLQDRRFQRIVWKADPSHPIRHFELNTVTYGTAAAPFLATQCLQTLADKTAIQFPMGSKALKSDFYVDDCMSGGSNLQEVKKTRDELNSLLTSAGFSLRKWVSNLPALTDDLEPSLREPIESQQTIKTLGIHWDPTLDSFKYVHQIKVPQKPITKRSILSYVSKYFDPLGWISPVILIGKLLIQELWQAGLTWDEPITDVFHQKWEGYLDSISQVASLHIPRWYFKSTYDPPADVELALVGYSDASEKAYGSVIYICHYRNNQYLSSSLVTSKTRLAPLKRISLPR